LFAFTLFIEKNMLSNLGEIGDLIKTSQILNLGMALLTLAITAIAGHFFVKFVLRRMARIIGPRLGTIGTEFARDDVLFGRLAMFVPSLILYQGVPLLPVISLSIIQMFQKLAVITAIIIGLGVISRLLNAVQETYNRYPIALSRPIKGYLQVASIILYAIGLVLIIATVLDKSPLVFVSGLGAMTAILLLVFRDTILSLVAGIQLTTNDLIRVGDWIEMPQFDADGDVVDIALHVVKVQNWDKTFTVIPTHKFLEHSFKNWRGMSDSGGRRIKRSIFIDVNSIRFLTEDELDRIAHFALLRDYIQSKRNEIQQLNQNISGNDVLVHNSRRLTNIGTFRAYLINYLRQHPKIHQNMTFLVRQLQPTPEGLPMEIYVFSQDTQWAPYESIQSDIFDHTLAIVSEFGLNVFQNPSGKDFQHLGRLLQQ
jgi:miniconductance mechanosensitive channel